MQALALQPADVAPVLPRSAHPALETNDVDDYLRAFLCSYASESHNQVGQCWTSGRNRPTTFSAPFHMLLDRASRVCADTFAISLEEAGR